MKIEEEQRLKEERDKITARKAKRKEKLGETLTSDKLATSISALFDSGDEGENGEVTEVTEEVKEVTANEREGEQLQEAAEKLDEDFLDHFMDNLNKQLSKLPKKDSLFYKALEHAIENAQETVDEAKQIVKAKKSSEKGPLRSGDDKEKTKLSEQSLIQDEVQTEDGDKENKEQQHSDGFSVTEETAVTEDEEEKEESPQTLKGVLNMLVEKNKAALAKKLEAGDLSRESSDDSEIDEEDLEVKTEGDDGEEEGLDEASLSDLGEEITEALQKKLNDAGLGDGGKSCPMSVFFLNAVLVATS